MPDPIESRQQCAPLIEYLDGSRPYDANTPTLDMRRLKEPFLCNICVDFFDTPYMLECGHTFCAACILSWLERHKTCPQCRIDIGNRPVPAYAVQHQVTVVRTMIFGHQAPAHTEVEREAQRGFQRLYPVARRAQFIQDREDQVNRCGVCGWELDEEGFCDGCGEHYRGAAQQGETLRASWPNEFSELTDDEEEEQDEEDPDLEGFVVDSDEPIEWEEMSQGDLDDESDASVRQRYDPTPVFISEDDDSSNESGSDDSDSVVYLGPSRAIRIPDTEDEDSDNGDETLVTSSFNTDTSNTFDHVNNSGSDGGMRTAESGSESDSSESDTTSESESDSSESDSSESDSDEDDSDNIADGLRALATSTSTSSSSNSNHYSYDSVDGSDTTNNGIDSINTSMKSNTHGASDTSNNDDDDDDDDDDSTSSDNDEDEDEDDNDTTTTSDSDNDEEAGAAPPSKKRSLDTINNDDDATETNSKRRPSHPTPSKTKRQRKGKGKFRGRGRGRGRGGRGRGWSRS